MLEIYLFINPIESHCLQSEKNVMKLVQEHHRKIHFGFLPLLNLHTVHQMMKKMNISDKDLATQNKLFQNAYAASLDYKAAELQGKKKGREFLLALQQRLLQNHLWYHEDLAVEIAEKTNLDMAMFLEDRRSDLVKRSFSEDQKIASEMGIRCHPSAVIFDVSQTDNYGLLVEDCQSLDVLREICSNYSHHFVQKENDMSLCAKRKQVRQVDDSNILYFL